jgi:hypothetical protein
MDHCHLIEHGSSVNNAETTGLGNRVLAALDAFGVDPQGWAAE